MSAVHAEGPDLDPVDDEGPQVGLLDLLTWLGEDKRLIGVVTGIAAVASVVVALLLSNVYTARTTLLPPGQQQPSGAAAALAALGALGGAAGGLAAKTPDELYVNLLKSDSVLRALDERFKLRERYDVETFEVLRREMPQQVRVSADKKSGVISVEVDDEDPKFAAGLANGYAEELRKVMGRLAITEAQQRRVFYESQLKATKDNLVKADLDQQRVQEKSGMIVLDKQAEAILNSMARLRAEIAEREVQLKVLRTGATAENPDVIRLGSELRALRAEMQRMESSPGGGSVIDLPAGKIPEAAGDFIRARREVKFQETLLESMLRQYEVAKLDEAKEGQTLQQIDIAQPPDRKSKPARAVIVLVSTLLSFVAVGGFVVARRYIALASDTDPQRNAAWAGLRSAWRLKR